MNSSISLILIPLFFLLLSQESRLVDACPSFSVELSTSTSRRQGMVSVVRPISSFETATEFLANLMPSSASKRGTSAILVHQNLQTCDRSLIMVHESSSSRGQVVMEITGNLHNNNESNNDNYDSIFYNAATETTIVSWDWTQEQQQQEQEDNTFAKGMGNNTLVHSLGTTFSECLTVTPDFIHGIQSWSWIQNSNSDDPSEKEFAFTSLDANQDLHVCLVVLEEPPANPFSFCRSSTASECGSFGFLCRLRRFIRCRLMSQ